jgi:hypothetical protein
MWELPEKSDRTGNYSGDSVFTDIPGAFTCRPPLGVTRHAFYLEPRHGGACRKEKAGPTPATRQDDISKIIGCAAKTLRKRLRDELDRGVASRQSARSSLTTLPTALAPIGLIDRGGRNPPGRPIDRSAGLIAPSRVAIGVLTEFCSTALSSRPIKCTL